jgi:hypothetical protein
MRSCALLGFCALTATVVAGTHQVPKDEPIATIGIPNDWKIQEHDEYLDTASRDGTVHILVLAAERKVAESLGEAIRYVRNTGAVSIKAETEKKETGQFRGKPLTTLSWEATHNGAPITIRCHVLSASQGKPLLIVFWGPMNKKNQGDLSRILESVQAP